MTSFASTGTKGTSPNLASAKSRNRHWKVKASGTDRSDKIGNNQHILTNLDLSTILHGMGTIKISSKVESAVWEDLRALAKESHQNVSGLLTEAISDYVRRRRVRPVVLDHLADSMSENDELGKLLAK
jgi:hypothetical protein